MSTRYVWERSVAKVNYEVDIDRENTIFYVSKSSLSAGKGYSIVDGSFYLTGETASISTGNSSILGISVNAISYRYVLYNSKYLFYAKNPTSNTLWNLQDRVDSTTDSNKYRIFLSENIYYDESNKLTIQLLKISENGYKKGDFVDNKSSNKSTTYPKDGVGSDAWYTYLGADIIDPYSVTYSTNSPLAGNSITVTANPNTPSYGGTIYYQFSYSTNGGSTWTNVGSKTTSASISVTVPSKATQFQVRALASDNLGFTSTTYITGRNLSVSTQTTYYTVTLTASPSAGGTTSGGGSYESGESVTVYAYANSGYTFTGWQRSGSTVSTSSSYTFTVSANVSLTAVFSASSSGGDSSGSGKHGAYVGVSSKARKINSIYIGINNIARSVKKGYIGVADKAQLFFAKELNVSYYGTVTALSQARCDLAATTVGNYALFGGGYNINKDLSIVDAYNSSLVRSTPTELNIARRDLAATTVGNYALFVGGYTPYSSNVDAYNNSLVRSTPTNLGERRENLAAATIGNYALFGGGWSGGGTTVYSTVYAFNENLVRSTPTDLSQARALLSATTVGNYALFAGGYKQGGGSSNIVDAYNKSLVRSTPTSLIGARYGFAATTVGNYALFGGARYYDATIKDFISSTVDAYDSSLVRSTPMGLSVGRDHLAATTIDGYALFGGGRKTSSPYTIYSTVDAYNELLVRSTPKALSVQRDNLTATTVGNYALFAGGRDTSSTVSSVVNVYTVN